MRKILQSLAFAICGSAAFAAGEGDSLLTELGSRDQGQGWEAVGRLIVDGRGFCTAVLVSPDRVLTAAHCVHDRASGGQMDAADIEFQAGMRNGRAEAYRGVSRVVIHPDYVFTGQANVDTVGTDLAVLVLDQPIRLPGVAPFEVAATPGRGEQVGVVSYAVDRAEAPSLQESCQVLSRQSRMLVLSCEVGFGSSGSPVFAIDGGVARIVSVVSARAELGDTSNVALGVSLDDSFDTLMAAVDAGLGGAASTNPTRLQIGQSTNANITAKFVRPEG